MLPSLPLKLDFVGGRSWLLVQTFDLSAEDLPRF
jgi:hypothetical protein